MPTSQFEILAKQNGRTKNSEKCVIFLYDMVHSLVPASCSAYASSLPVLLYVIDPDQLTVCISSPKGVPGASKWL